MSRDTFTLPACLLLASVFITVVGINGKGDCVEEFSTLAEDSIEVTDDLAELTVTNLQRILSGGSPNLNRLDALGEQHRDNYERLEELQARCN